MLDAARPPCRIEIVPALSDGNAEPVATGRRDSDRRRWRAIDCVTQGVGGHQDLTFEVVAANLDQIDVSR
jgi:hypothetical protein